MVIVQHLTLRIKWEIVLKKGIGDEAPTEPIIKVGEIGYCRFLKFKCAAARTCQAWVSGGPIKD